MTKSLPAARASDGAARPPRPTIPRATRVTSTMRFTMDLSSLAGARSERRVEHVAQPVAEEIEAKHGDEDRDAWKGRHPPRRGEELSAFHDHVAPAGRRRLDAEAQVGETRLDENRLTEEQRALYDHGGRRVGEHVPQEDAPVARAQRAGGLDEIP